MLETHAPSATGLPGHGLRASPMIVAPPPLDTGSSSYNRKPGKKYWFTLSVELDPTGLDILPGHGPIPAPTTACQERPCDNACLPLSPSPASAAGTLPPDGVTFDLVRRHYALSELIDSEEMYLRHLAHIMEHVATPVLASGGVSLPPILWSIAWRWSKLYRFHTRFAMSLQKAVHNEEFLHLASAFASLANNISIYTSYCAHYQQHHLALDALRADPHWRKFMQDFQSRITLEPDHRRLELCDYFIMPVQRLCRYPLLLKEITRHTPPFAPEYKYLEASLKTMTSVCSRINAGKRNHESIELTRRFILGCKGTKGPMLAGLYNLGTIVISGPLLVIGPREIPGKLYGFALFNSILVVFSAKKRGIFVPESWLALRQLQVCDTITSSQQQQQQTHHKHAWQLYHKPSGQLLELVATSKQEKRLWMRYLGECIEGSSQQVSPGCVLPILHTDPVQALLLPFSQGTLSTRAGRLHWGYGTSWIERARLSQAIQWLKPVTSTEIQRTSILFAQPQQHLAFFTKPPGGLKRRPPAAIPASRESAFTTLEPHEGRSKDHGARSAKRATQCGPLSNISEEGAATAVETAAITTRADVEPHSAPCRASTKDPPRLYATASTGEESACQSSLPAKCPPSLPDRSSESAPLHPSSQPIVACSKSDHGTLHQLLGKLSITRHRSLNESRSRYRLSSECVTSLLARSKTHGKSILSAPFSKMQQSLSRQATAAVAAIRQEDMGRGYPGTITEAAIRPESGATCISSDGC